VSQHRRLLIGYDVLSQLEYVLLYVKILCHNLEDVLGRNICFPFLYRPVFTEGPIPPDTPD